MSGGVRRMRWKNGVVPSGYVKIAIENGHLYWIFPLKIVIFHSYVKLPEGKHRFWANYNDLTVLPYWETMVSKGNHPQMALIQVSESYTVLKFIQSMCVQMLPIQMAIDVEPVELFVL